MNADEYGNLERVEREHWYYSGKRRLVRYWLNQCGPLGPSQHLLDVGAGTGIFASELRPVCQVSVLDDHEESLRILRSRFSPGQVLQPQAGCLPVEPGSLDFVTALDVLEHVADDAAMVRDFSRVLKPGGCAIVTVPASMLLWSDWDVVLHHYRRYDRRGLLSLFPASQWEVEYVNYTNVVAFPAVWLVRKWRSLTRRTGSPETRRSEDVVPMPWVNSALRWVFVRLGRTRLVRFPFGVSLILVARRKAGA